MQKFKNWEGLSSHIKTTSYNEEQETLTITYQFGAIYNYFKVPVDVYQKLLKSDYISKFVNNNIKGKFEYQKMN